MLACYHGIWGANREVQFPKRYLCFSFLAPLLFVDDYEWCQNWKPHETCFSTIPKWPCSDGWLQSYERLNRAQILVFLGSDARLFRAFRGAFGAK